MKVDLIWQKFYHFIAVRRGNTYDKVQDEAKSFSVDEIKIKLFRSYQMCVENFLLGIHLKQSQSRKSSGVNSVMRSHEKLYHSDNVALSYISNNIRS